MTSLTTDWRAELATLMREQQAGLWRYLRYLGCNSAEAEDLVQETFLTVWREGFEVRTPSASAAYLRTVARNRFLMARRKKRAVPLNVDLEAADAVWTSVANEDGLDAYLVALRECLQTALTPRVRQALELHYRDQSSRSATAAVLQVSVEGVKTMLRRARLTLRECVERKIGK